MQRFDYIVVGHGIAGALLSKQLRAMGQSVLVVDAFNPESSSQVAAGVFNPVTGRKMVKTWMADLFFPYLFEFYPQLEQELGLRFFHPMPLLHVFNSVKEQNDVLSKIADEHLELYFDTGFKLDDNEPVQQEFGCIRVNACGWVNIPLMLKALRQLSARLNALLEEHFDFKELQTFPGKVVYKNTEAKGIIFCEGVAAQANPYFSYLPFQPAKGEILDLDIEGLSRNYILKKSSWLVPAEGGQYRSGATFKPVFENPLPTAEAKQYLEQKLEQLLKVPYRVRGQRAAVRPAVKDRRPLLGRHPESAPLYIFNGMGSKGISMVPWLSRHFSEHLVQGTELLPELDIRRFIKQKTLPAGRAF